jgi:YaiO family outer membrane protein
MEWKKYLFTQINFKYFWATFQFSKNTQPIRSNLLYLNLNERLNSLMKIRLLFVVLLHLSFFLTASAQKAFNGDSLLLLARNNAFTKNYPLAIEQCDTILNHYPDYADVSILKARIYSWDKNFAEAKKILEKTIADKPDNLDAHKAISDNAMWSNNAEEAITFSERGILLDPNNTELMLKKAKAQVMLKRYAEAEKTLAAINQINPDNAEANALSNEIKILKRVNTIGVYNLHDWFTSIYGQRNLLSVEYKRALDVGPVLARINYANRFGFNGLQYEADFYPRLTKTLSGYLNYGFSSDNNLFPKHKMGAEIFNNFSKKFTASLGIRYMIFPNNELVTLTGSAGLYTGKYWFGLRAYVTPTKQRVGESVFLFARRFLKDDKNYLTLTLGQGVSPENTSNSLNFDSYYFLNTQTLKLQWVKAFASRYSFQLGTECTRWQVPFDTDRSIFQFTLDTGIKYQF